MLISLINKNLKKCDIKKHYHNFTEIEKIMYDQDYAWDDISYPTLYWKILAGIFYSINKKKMPAIKIDNTINTIYDIYNNFIECYIPFKTNNIDIKLRDYSYDASLFSCIKDKITVYIYILSREGNLHPIECSLCNSISFISSIDFSSFYDSLVNYRHQPPNYVFTYVDIYNTLYNESNVFKNKKDIQPFQSNEKIMFNIIYDSVGNKHSIITLGLKMMISGDFNIRLDDVHLMVLFCKYIFNSGVSEIYIKDILLMMKYNNVPLGVVMIIDKEFYKFYNTIKSDIEYLIKHSSKIDISQLPITSDNFITLCSSCNTIEKFSSLIRIAKSNRWLNDKSYEECVTRFIRSMMEQNFVDFNSVNLINGNVFNTVVKLRHEILANYIKSGSIELVNVMLNSLEEWDFNNSIIVDAVGESCSISIFKRIYGLGPYDSKIIRQVSLKSFSVGSNILPVELGIEIDEIGILDSIIDSGNLEMIYACRDMINIFNINKFITKTIESNNIETFVYLLKTYNHFFFSMSGIVESIILNNRVEMMKYVFKKDVGSPRSIVFNLDEIFGVKTENDTFYVKMLIKMVDNVSSEMLNLIFNKMSFDYNDTHTQLFVLRDLFCKILKTNNSTWLKRNVKLLPILYFDPKTKLILSRSYRTYSDDYISPISSRSTSYDSLSTVVSYDSLSSLDSVDETVKGWMKNETNEKIDGMKEGRDDESNGNADCFDCSAMICDEYF